MKFAKNKTTIGAIAIITILALSSFAVLLPVHAQALTGKYNVPTWCYISAFPSPIGIGQYVSLFAWMDVIPPTAIGSYGDRWYNLTFVETKPDGTKVTFPATGQGAAEPGWSDPVGDAFETISLTELGTYSFQFVFPGQLLAGNNLDPAQVAAGTKSIQGYADIGNYYEPSSSDVLNVTVQSTPIPSAPAYPLPTSYWSNPVSQAGHSGLWTSVTGDWIGFTEVGFGINDYTQAPTTSHIAWTLPYAFGGVAGMSEPNQASTIANGADNYYSGLSYETMVSNPIIMSGQLYLNVAKPPIYGFYDINIQTGKEVWYQNATADTPWAGLAATGATPTYPHLSFGQELYYNTPNQSGVQDYLWSTYTAPNGTSVWSLYDAFTGNWICNLWGVPGMASNAYQDANGNICIYTANFAVKSFNLWNSTDAINGFINAAYDSNDYWEWRMEIGNFNALTYGSTEFGNTTYAITGTLPAGYTTAKIVGIDPVAQEAIYSTAWANFASATVIYPTPNTFSNFAISTNPATIGQVLWSQTYNWPSGNLTIAASQYSNIGDGVFMMRYKEINEWACFSEATGALLWTSAPETDTHMYDVTSAAATPYTLLSGGVFYASGREGAGGDIYAYNVTNGDLLFHYNSGSSEYTTYWADIPVSIIGLSDSNIYWCSGEHSPGPALEPGFELGDVNTTTGQNIWNITFWDGPCSCALADGYLVSGNVFDNQVYAFGMGPTQTTVGTDWSNRGQNLVIQGSVLDISAGTTQSNIAARFPQGVAAVSDASMTPYMEYVYMQNPIPANTTGVPVTLTAIDPNGNTINLGTTTSDASGHYALSWNTANGVPGKYTVIATFSGTNAYWPSYSQTTFQVDPAAAVTAAPTATPTSVANMYFVPAIAGLFVVIIIVAIVLALLMLRKKP